MPPHTEPLGTDDRPSVFAALLALAAVKTALHVVGFGRTVSHIKRVQGGPRPPDASDMAVAHATARAVAVSAAFSPWRALCLEQSLAVLYLLRRRGLPAELCMGVQPYGFTAHAWIELNGEVLNDDSELLRKLVRFPVIPG